jgi:hypothetical protein
MNNPLLVRPCQLLCVHVRRPDGAVAVYHFIACSYVQVPGPAIAVQLGYDPANQAPGGAYDLPEANVQWALIEPEQLVRIHPYGVG